MADKHWYLRFDASAWLASTMTMSAEAAGAYIHMLSWSWLHGAIPDDGDALTKISRSGKKIAQKVLATKWRKTPDGWINERLERERQYCVGRSEIAIRNANARWSHMPTQCNGIANAYANAMPNGCDGNAIHSHSHSHSQNTETEGAVAPDASQEEPATADAAERIHWSPMKGWSGITDEHRAAWIAASPGLDITLALARMGAWLAANPAKARKKNWARFITGWLARERPATATPTRSDY